MNCTRSFMKCCQAFLFMLVVLLLLAPQKVTASTQDRNFLVAFFSLSSSSGSNEEQELAPDFELKEINGGSVRLSQFRGDRPVLIYFWATWCPHCVSSRPAIARLREQIPADELAILGINVGSGDSLERVKRFQKKRPVSWPILYDDGEKVTQAYEVTGIPLYVLVDKEGKIVYRSHRLPENLSDYLD